LLRAVGDDELLLQSIALGQGRVAAGGEHQTVVVAQRSSGARATEGKAWMRGLKPTGRLRTCQPLSWKMRCTVFLLNPSKCVNARSSHID
jgi:hypothetical protein